MYSSSRSWLSLLLLMVACSDDGNPPGPEATPASVVATETAGTPVPADNPMNADKVALGRLLFWDPILSGNRDLACASCHDPAFGYGDGRKVSLGTGNQPTPRGALTILDTAWNGWTALNPLPDPTEAPMFWDNRVRSLELQAHVPMTGSGEMAGSFPEIANRLSAIPDYVSRFTAAFGNATIDETAIDQAIATFERTLVTVPSYQRWLAGDETAISDSAKRGVSTFRDSGCSRCHSGPMLSDYTLHRFTRDGEAIRTPSLRNVTRTAPYMHDGRAADFDAVFDIYRHVDDDADPNFRALRVPNRDDRADVEAFFASTSDGDFDESVPASVPSGLTVGGRRP